MSNWNGLPLRLEMISRTPAHVEHCQHKKIPDNGGPHWELLREIRWEFTLDDDIRLPFVVPAGWITDLTSIPWWVPFVHREGLHTPASVLHDFLYAKPGHRKRSAVDELYLYAMKDNGVRRITRMAIYRGVRLGGWKAWRRYRRKQRETK